MFSLMAKAGFFLYMLVPFSPPGEILSSMYLLIHVFFYIQNHRCSDCIDERVEISLLFGFDVTVYT